jgi:Protein of unknown function (DUF1822)
MSNLSGNQEGTFFLGGRVAQSMGDYLARLERYEEAREEYQQAKEDYEKILPSSPDFDTAQKNQEIVLRKLVELPAKQKSIEAYQLERLFATNLERNRQVVQNRINNLSQWLENVFEEGWQTIEQLFGAGEPSFAYAYALRSRDAKADNSETISQLIRLLYDSQDEYRRKQAAQKLGEIGAGNSEELAALIHLVQTAQDEETRWAAADSLWRLDPNNVTAGIRKVKDLGMQIREQAVALMVAVLPKPDQTIAVLLRVYPMRNQEYLPSHLALLVLDEAGNTFLETEAREPGQGGPDNYIQLKFSGSRGEQFSVRVSLGEAGITEEFAL